jgi:hypothetical protein
MRAAHKLTQKWALLQILQNGGLGAKWSPLKVMNNVTNPSYFVSTFVNKK